MIATLRRVLSQCNFEQRFIRSDLAQPPAWVPHYVTMTKAEAVPELSVLISNARKIVSEARRQNKLE